MSATLQVYGHIWQGHRACYAYTVGHAPTTYIEALRMAGDFRDLIDYRVVDNATNRVVRGWRAGFTNRRFSRIVNA